MLTFDPLEADNAVQIQTFRGMCAVLGAHVDDLAATWVRLMASRVHQPDLPRTGMAADNNERHLTNRRHRSASYRICRRGQSGSSSAVTHRET
jgi:hypothetical protein